MRLEPTDLAILRELLGWGSGNFPAGSLNLSADELAQRADVHRNTFQRRLARLREGGVIEGFLYEPQAAPLDLVRAGHFFPGARFDGSDHVAELLAPFPFVSIVSMHAEACFLHTWHDTAADVAGDAERLRAALKAERPWRSYVSSSFPPHPSDALALSPLDRRLVLGLRRGFRRSVADVAARTGTSRRHAARRIKRLVAAQAGALMPMFRPGRIEGMVFAIYDQEQWNGSTAGLLAKVFPERIMGPQTGAIRPMVLVPFPSLAEALERRAEAAKVPGLESLQVNLVRDFRFPAACDDWLAERVRNAPPSAARG